MYLFWWRNENRKVTCAACPLALGVWDSGTLIRPHKSVKSPSHYKIPPNNSPPKTTTQESYLKVMMPIYWKGFGLYPLV